MPYATVADITTLLDTVNITIDANTNPTQLEVEEFIAQFESEINGVLSSQGYTYVPAVGLDDISLLKRYVAERTAVKVWEIVFVSIEYPEKIRNWLQGYNGFISRLRKAEQLLINQKPLSPSGGSLKVGYFIMTAPYDE
jgi:hypothetical protein